MPNFRYACPGFCHGETPRHPLDMSSPDAAHAQALCRVTRGACMHNLLLADLLHCSLSDSNAGVTWLIKLLIQPQHEFISWTALQAAAREGHAEVVEMLLKAGASPNDFDQVCFKNNH
jgi:hypothetical protein